MLCLIYFNDTNLQKPQILESLKRVIALNFLTNASYSRTFPNFFLTYAKKKKIFSVNRACQFLCLNHLPIQVFFFLIQVACEFWGFFFCFAEVQQEKAVIIFMQAISLKGEKLFPILCLRVAAFILWSLEGKQ